MSLWSRCSFIESLCICVSLCDRSDAMNYDRCLWYNCFTMDCPDDSGHLANTNERFWNLSLYRDRSSLANTAAIDGTILPSSSAFYTSAVLTDVGICVGMRNVNLNCESQHCFHQLKIPNCYNLNIVGEQNKQTWENACTQFAFPIVGASGSIYVHHPSVLPPTPPLQPSFTSIASANAAHNFRMHNENSLATSFYDNRLSFANHNNRFLPTQNSRTYANPSNAEDPSAPELPSSKNESHRRCHVAAPKKKWIRNYMLSKFVFITSLCVCVSVGVGVCVCACSFQFLQSTKHKKWEESEIWSIVSESVFIANVLASKGHCI